MIDWIAAADISRLVVCTVALMISGWNWKTARDDYRWTRRSMINGSRGLVAQGMLRGERLRFAVILGLCVIAVWALVGGRPYEPNDMRAILWVSINNFIQTTIAASVAGCGWKDRLDREYLVKWRKPVVVRKPKDVG